MAGVNEGRCPGHAPPVQFLRNLYLAREMCAGIQLFATPHTVAALQAAAARDGAAKGLPTAEMRTTVPDDFFLAATLVFPLTKRVSDPVNGFPDLTEALEAPDFAPGRDPTPDGIRAAALLREWAYGAEAAGLPLVHVVIKGTLEQAEACVAACVAALLDCVAPPTCLSLLALAERCGCGPLYCAAQRCALDHFEEAVREDAGGLRLLSATQMARLLSADALGVASEYGAFVGLEAWAAADAASRVAPPGAAPQQLSAFAALLRDAVRLSAMTYEELERVDQSPLTARDRKAIGVVALAIIQATNGMGECGAPPRRRRGPAPPRAPLLPAALETGRLQLEGRGSQQEAMAAADGNGCGATDMLVSPTRQAQMVPGGDAILPTQRALFGDSLIVN